MEFRFQFAGLAESARLLTERAAALQVATRTATGLAAHLVERNTKTLLAQKSHPRRTPTPSQPGEPPAAITGTLMRSVTVRGPTGAAGTYRASVGPTVIYGRIHELGGQAGRHRATRLPARPYLAPAVDMSREQIAALYYRAWRGALT